MSSQQQHRARPGIAPSFGRRGLDILVAAIGLLILSPVLVAVALAVRLTSPGPALFRQQRVGQGGVPFTMLKFRSMGVGDTGPLVTAGGDSRVTPLGKFLRHTSIDELPQLFNVLLGEMTLVGPRPETIPLAERYPAELMSVFEYRPGMTGLVQLRMRDVNASAIDDDVEGLYLREDVPRRVALDLEFESDASLASTIRLLAATGAYLVTGSR